MGLGLEVALVVLAVVVVTVVLGVVIDKGASANTPDGDEGTKLS